MSLTIKLHEAKVDYSGSRVPKSVADAYALLDDYFCDDSGNLSKDAIEKVMLTFKNERDLYDRSKSNAVKSHALAWDALLREIKATLEWDDETPHATNLSSEQVKNWFKLKGRDFKEDLKPLVDAIDRQRKEWWGVKESKKSESDTADAEQVFKDMADSLGISDRSVITTDGDRVKFVLKLKLKDLEDYAWEYNPKLKVVKNIASPTADAFDGARKTVNTVEDAAAWLKGGIEELLNMEKEAIDLVGNESKKSESFVTDLTKAIQDSPPEVLLSDDAVTHFDDYDKMLDEFEGAYQTIVHVVGPKGTDELMFLYVPEENIIAIGDFDVYRENATRAKDLMEKFVRGELNKVPGNTDGLEGTDYVAIIDGNTYTSTVFIEGK